MQTVLDHYGRTPITAFIDGIAKEDTPQDATRTGKPPNPPAMAALSADCPLCRCGFWTGDHPLGRTLA